MLTAWEVGAPRPWNDYVTGVDLTGPRRPGARFEAEGVILQQHHALRRHLPAALAATGEGVPRAIDRRGRLAHHSWPAGEPDPISQDALLALTRASDPSPDDDKAPHAESATRPDGQPAAGRDDTGDCRPAGIRPARPTLAERVETQACQLKTVPPPALDPPRGFSVLA